MNCWKGKMVGSAEGWRRKVSRIRDSVVDGAGA